MKSIIINTVEVAVSYAVGSFALISLIMSTVWNNNVTIQDVLKTWAYGMLIVSILILIADIVTAINMFIIKEHYI